jgi:hypothetical protein
MGPRSKIEALPPEVRTWLEGALVDNRFGEYDALTASLQERGYSISRSSVHRFGQEFEERLKRLQTSRDMARAISEQLGDDQADMANAVNQMALHRSFELLQQIDVDPEEVDFPKFVRAISSLSGASINLGKYRSEVRAKAKVAADETVKLLKKAGGLSDEMADEIKRKILGIAT